MEIFDVDLYYKNLGIIEIENYDIKKSFGIENDEL